MCLRALSRSAVTLDQIFIAYGLGTSLTKIHLTLKIPFHLSEAQTVEFCDSSTLLYQLLVPTISMRTYGVSISATPQKCLDPLTEKNK